MVKRELLERLVAQLVQQVLLAQSGLLVALQEQLEPLALLEVVEEVQLEQEQMKSSGKTIKMSPQVIQLPQTKTQ
jgi:hypothetical protein